MKEGPLPSVSLRSSTPALREPEPHFHPLNNGRPGDWLIEKECGPWVCRTRRPDQKPRRALPALPPPWEPTDRGATGTPGAPGGGAGWSSSAATRPGGGDREPPTDPSAASSWLLTPRDPELSRSPPPPRRKEERTWC